MPAPTARDVLDELRPLGRDSYKRVLLNHGVPEPVYGVTIAELKRVQRRVKRDHRLALDLFDTGVYDAMYLAGLVADDPRMSPDDLERWIARATAPPLFAYTIPWVACGGSHGRGLGLRWIESADPNVAVAGWSTLGGVVSVTADADLDLAEVSALLRRVATTIHGRPDDVRYAMNGFVISVGSHVAPLTGEAVAAAREVGTVSVDMGDTACRVPDAVACIEKARRRGTVGRKRKTVKC